MHLRMFFAAGLFAAAAAAPGDVVTINASRDATLFENPVGEVANGAGQHFFAGTTAFGELRRALIHFDIAAAIPAGATINAATLTLYMSRTAAAAEIVSLHRTLTAWGEGASDAPAEEGGGTNAEPGDATWLHRFYADALWTTPGGDFEPVASDSAVVIADGFYSWGSTGALIADVQNWLDNPAQNYGWTILGNEEFDQTAKRFDSREHPEPARRPSLTIDFTPIPEPAALMLLSAGILALRTRGR